MQRALSRLAFLFLLPLSFSSPTFATATPDSWAEWQDARNHFSAGHWNEALSDLLAHPNLSDSSYYYNVGTTYYRLGNYGLAVANLEKANRIRPHHPDIQANLAIARQSLGQKIGYDLLDPASFWIEQLADQVEFDEVRATLGFLLLGLFLIWIRSYSKTHQINKVFFHPAAYLGTFAVGITFGVYLMRLWANTHPCAVLVEAQVIRSGPGEHFQQLKEVELGSKLRVLGPISTPEETQDLWNQVRYSTDGIGWVKSKSLLVL
jgi:tetratricopeptide (TPR) repeat protein